ncbi:uncharacterized protein LOC144619737 [Crassostrea virginica]
MASLTILSQVAYVFILWRKLKSDPPLREDPFLTKINYYQASRRKQMKFEEKQNGKSSDISVNEKSERMAKGNDKSITQNSIMNDSIHSDFAEENQGVSSKKTGKKHGKKRGAKVNPILDAEIPNIKSNQLPPIKK